MNGSHLNFTGHYMQDDPQYLKSDSLRCL